ncbi:MAG: hypothetical protein CMN58_04860 [Solibacterales bacterium]|nr:hypothetical protein [Bryobacterales bacterium]|tara:strand:- start:522 stop:1787 length:1266 start_codon:yes stop_codon:yes gene_type:complete
MFISLLVIVTTTLLACDKTHQLPTTPVFTSRVLTQSTPFVSPKGEYVTRQEHYHTFRIPGMTVTQNGTILAFAEGRRGFGNDPRRDRAAPIDLVMRKSIDNGQTWQPMVVLESGFHSAGNLFDFADPTPVYDQITGVVFLFYGQWPDVGPTTPIHGQSTDAKAGNQVVWVRSSSDNGETWSNRRQIIYPDEPHETSDGLYWRHAEPGPGSGIQLQWQNLNEQLNGRLVVPAKRSGSITPDGESNVTQLPFVYYSDDHGKNWRIGNVTPGPEADEDEVVELKDGRILLDARQNKGSFRRRHLSSDGGITWGPDRSDSISITPVDTSLIRYDDNRILFSGPRGENGLNRNSITIWTSYDEGETFRDPIKLNDGFAAYSVMQRLADGSLGILVETSSDTDEGSDLKDDSYGAITFYRLDMSEAE